MGIITKEVEVKLWGKNIKHYNSLGYKGKHGDILIVKVEDLQNGSNAKIQYLCDYCKKEVLTMTYADFVRRTKEINKMAYKKCVPQKLQDVMNIRYGVNHYSQTQDYKNKFHNTCMDKYGETYRKQFMDKAFKTFLDKTGYNFPSQSPKVREKVIQTCIKHYGVDTPLLSEEVYEKTKKTNLERYGCFIPSQSLKVKEKMIQTNFARYGYRSTLQSPEIREKITQSFYTNSSQKASKQQHYICNLYQGILNFPVKKYNVDIYLSKYNLVVEYDGGGHMLNVVTGKLTQEEFNQKEIIRNNIIKYEGYKQMRIVSTKDLLPSDSVLLQILDYACDYFSQYPEHSWIEFNIDTSLIRNAEYKDGIFFNYGELHAIKSVS